MNSQLENNFWTRRGRSIVSVCHYYGPLQKVMLIKGDITCNLRHRGMTTFHDDDPFELQRDSFQ